MRRELPWGELVRYALKVHGWTPGKVARVLDCDPRWLDQLERRDVFPLPWRLRVELATHIPEDLWGMR